MKTQGGFIGFGILIAIILGLVVIGGGAYYVMHQNTAPTAQPNYPDISTTQQPQGQTTTNTSVQATTNTTATSPIQTPAPTPAINTSGSISFAAGALTAHSRTPTISGRASGVTRIHVSIGAQAGGTTQIVNQGDAMLTSLGAGEVGWSYTQSEALSNMNAQYQVNLTGFDAAGNTVASTNGTLAVTLPVTGATNSSTINFAAGSQTPIILNVGQTATDGAVSITLMSVSYGNYYYNASGVQGTAPQPVPTAVFKVTAQNGTSPTYTVTSDNVTIGQGFSDTTSSNGQITFGLSAINVQANTAEINVGPQG